MVNVLGTQNIFLFRSVKQEYETKLERGSARTLNLRMQKKLFIQERGNVGTRNAKAKLRNGGARERKAFQEHAPISDSCFVYLVIVALFALS